MSGKFNPNKMKNKLYITILITFFSLNMLTVFCQTNWSLSNTGIPSVYSPNDFALASNGDIYLAASQWNGSTFSPKLLKSINNGSSWTEITMTGLTNVQNTNSIIFSGSTLLLAGSNSSTASYYVYASTDNGLNWTLSNTGITTGYSPNDFAIAPNGDVYLVCSHWNGTSFSPNLLKSTNNGSSWTEITMNGLTNVQNLNSIIFNGSKLLLSGSGASATYYVYSSTDNGSNWTSSNSGIPSGYSLNDFTNTTGQEIYGACSQWNGTSFSPHIIKSTNAGVSWIEITGLTGLTNLQNTNSIIYSNSKLLLSGSNSSTASYFVFISAISSGIEDENNNISFSIFPNPSIGQINIASSDNIKEIKITDGLGQVIYQTKSNGNNFSLQIDRTGIYFITLMMDKETITRKLIICN